jgi:hypothetical protein
VNTAFPRQMFSAGGGGNNNRAGTPASMAGGMPTLTQQLLGVCTHVLPASD